MTELQNNLMPDGLPVKNIIVTHEKPERFVDIPNNIIHIVSVYMNVVLKRTAKQKEVDTRKLIINAKSMFSNGIRYKDDLWMQHTASSLREIVCFVDLNNGFNLSFKSVPAYESDQLIKETIDKLRNIKSYISDVVHFVKNPRLGYVDKIYVKS